ncbi:unnamed protein product [Eruca vesicaria subsp. sativa]|uniref:Uncharacterized protein n=1 Tax=Eruca vesicaria subsp. sativa TaxID=29727 RepID=A0ABC8JGY3_ERUVS|nr:unnamed protein product [Eruca vesicaria subsp. sativa]
MVWREKSQSQLQPTGLLPETEINSSSHLSPRQQTTPVRSIERNLAECDFPHLPRIPTMSEVIQDLVDVSIRYTNCADPVESEARRQRVLQTNAEGIMEETTAEIIAAATTARHAAVCSLSANLPTPLLLIGPNIDCETADLPKRRGRPPREKKQTAKPKILPGTASRKRNLNLATPSPGKSAWSPGMRDISLYLH